MGFSFNNITAKVSEFLDKFVSNSNVDSSRTTEGTSFWQRFALNFGSSANSSTNQQVLHRVAQNVDTWRSDGDEKKKNQNPTIIRSKAGLDPSDGPERNALPAPKAIIIPLKEGRKQAGYDELSRRVIQSTLEQNGTRPSNIELEELMALPASKKMDMHGWLDKDWNFHDKPGLMPSAVAHVDANGNKVYGYKMTLSPTFQQGVLNDYAKIKSELAATPDKKAVIDMNLNERLTETVKIAYEKGYISKEVKEQLGNLTPEELAATFALGGAIGIAATDAQVAAALGPIGGGLALAYTAKQMAEFDHIARGAARATNREHLDQPAKDFGAWMGSLSKDGVLALVGAAGAFTAPKVMPKVEQVITNKVNGVKEALTEKPQSLGQPLPATTNGAPVSETITQTPKAGKTPLDKINDPIEARTNSTNRVEDVNSSTISKAEQVRQNKIDGMNREAQIQAQLVKENPNAQVFNERYLRDKNGNRLIDPDTGKARRLDFVIVENSKVTKIIEVTSETASKVEQLAKTSRVRAIGEQNQGTYIRDPQTKKLIEVPKNVAEEVMRLP